MRKENRLGLTLDPKPSTITAVRGDSRFRQTLAELLELGIYHSQTEMLYDAVYLLARSYGIEDGLPQPVKRVPRLELSGKAVMKELAGLLS